jgi:hypothetical protein
MSTTTVDDRITAYSPLVATTEFAADFAVFDNADLIVIHDGVKRTDFTVSATYVEGIATDAKAIFSPGIIGEVLVVGARSPRRVSRFTNGAPIPTWQQNLVADILTAQAQERQRDLDRAVLVPVGSAGYAIEAGIDEGKLLVMGAGGRVEGGPSYEGVTEAVSDAQNAAAAAALSEQQALQHKSDAQGFSVAAANSAVAAASSQGQAQNLVNAAQAAYVGFQPGTFYDLGRVTDSLELFPSDLGRVSDI